MAYTATFATEEPSRGAIDALQEPVMLEFGVDWCPHCQRAQPLIQTALNNHPQLRHIKIEDGSGRPLGRSFRVKLWPTLVILNAGEEVARVVRPTDVSALEQALAQLKAG